MTISFREFVNGTTKRFSVKVDDFCEDCNGTGARDGKLVDCQWCHGQGAVSFKAGYAQVTSTCRHCGGSGKQRDGDCPTCHGSGFKRVSRDAEVVIPAGTSNGTTFTVAGKGGKGINGGENGNVLVVVNVEPSKLFAYRDTMLHGIDFLTFAYVDPITASVGGTVKVMTPFCEWIDVEIKPGTNHGDQVIVKGKGMRSNNLASDGAGDLYVEIRLVPLVNLSDDQAERLKDLRTGLSEKNDPKRSEYENLVNGYVGRHSDKSEKDDQTDRRIVP